MAINQIAVVDDFVVLGGTIPEPTKSNGACVCTAGYSRQMNGLMRVYPISISNYVKRWESARLILERNLKDTRKESWSLKKGMNIRDVLIKKGRVKKENEFSFLESLSGESIKQFNQEKMSLGILQVDKIDLLDMTFEARENKPDTPDPCDLQPRLSFRDADGVHRLQIRDWGCYRLINKYHSNPEILWSALNFDNRKKYKLLLFLGNMAWSRNAWLIISVLQQKKAVNYGRERIS